MNKLFSILANPKTTYKIISWFIIIAELLLIISFLLLYIIGNPTVVFVSAGISLVLFSLCTVLAFIPYLCHQNDLINKQDDEDNMN